MGLTSRKMMKFPTRTSTWDWRLLLRSKLPSWLTKILRAICLRNSGLDASVHPCAPQTNIMHKNTTWLITYTQPPAQLCRLLSTYLVPTRIRVDPILRIRQVWFKPLFWKRFRFRINRRGRLEFWPEEPFFQNLFCLQPCKENCHNPTFGKSYPPCKLFTTNNKKELK